MPEPGLIHDTLDIKILILYVLSRLPGPVELPALSNLVLVDGGFTYFDFTACLDNLEKTGHAVLRSNGWAITEKGAQNAALVESSLPVRVRDKADDLIAPLARAMRREAMIKASRRDSAAGCLLELSLSDGLGEMLNVRLLVPSEAAGGMEERFKADPEGFYAKILALLSES